MAAQETSNLRGPAPFQQAYLGQRRMARTQLAKIRWWRVALAWGLFTVFMVLLVYVQAQASVHPVPWRLVVLGPLLDCVSWMVLTPVVFWLAAHFDLTTPRRRLPHLLLHAGASFGLTLLQRALSRTGLALLAVPGIHLSGSALLATVNVWVPLCGLSGRRGCTGQTSTTHPLSGFLLQTGGFTR